MRYTHNKADEVGDTRVMTAFLLLPRRIDDETRWWENATWVEEYQRVLIAGANAIVPFEKWVPVKWYP